MGKKYLLTVAMPDYRPSIENVELSSPVQHNASPDKNSRTTVMVSFRDVTGHDSIHQLSSFCALCTTVNGGVGGQLSTGDSFQDGGRIGPLCEGVWPQ
ncbi:hypothetical protein TNCV_4926681 [Trichonephila clavipes]|nr:hypothetical protein TNCV_4926681 [Trichonephila clavipes]